MLGLYSVCLLVSHTDRNFFLHLNCKLEICVRQCAIFSMRCNVMHLFCLLTSWSDMASGERADWKHCLGISSTSSGMHCLCRSVALSLYICVRLVVCVCELKRSCACLTFNSIIVLRSLIHVLFLASFNDVFVVDILCVSFFVRKINQSANQLHWCIKLSLNFLSFLHAISCDCSCNCNCHLSPFTWILN